MEGKCFPICLFCGCVCHVADYGGKAKGQDYLKALRRAGIDPREITPAMWKRIGPRLTCRSGLHQWIVGQGYCKLCSRIRQRKARAKHGATRRSVQASKAGQNGS